MNKNSIIPTLVIAAVLIFGGVFIFESMKHGTSKEPVVVTKIPPVATTTPPRNVESMPGVILVGERAEYVNLSVNEKKIIDRFLEKKPNVYKEILEYRSGDELGAKNILPLKYYDDEKIVIGVPNGKGAIVLNIYDAKTYDQLNNDPQISVFLYGNNIETPTYIISASQSLFSYYKKGAKEFVVVPNSQLTSKNEWYIKTGGMQSVYDFTFDEGTRTLSASVFKNVYGIDKENPKLRTATFVLP